MPIDLADPVLAASVHRYVQPGPLLVIAPVAVGEEGDLRRRVGEAEGVAEVAILRANA